MSGIAILKTLRPKKKVLVVGGAGYIGSHVCKALKQSGFEPIVYDNLSTGHIEAVQFGSLIQGSSQDEQKLTSLMQTLKPIAVIHLASLINVRDSINHPALYYKENLGGALSLLKAMQKSEVKTLIFSSTAAVYGTPQYLPIDENHPKAPLNAYGKTKWTIEGMIEDFAALCDIRFVTFRYFNACGADLEGKIGEAHDPETHLIPLAIQTALGKKNILQIYGNNYPTPDGTALRDYIHVSDIASAHISALSYLLEKGLSQTINLGTGQGYSVQEIIRAVEKFSQKTVNIQIAPRLAHDSPQLVASPKRGYQILNWTPKFSDLNTIISSAWNWEMQKSLVFAIN